jgi:hypothetical protein
LGNARFETPIFILLQHLIRLGTLLEAEEYEEIVDLGLTWGFEHEYQTGEIGKARLRRAMAQEAPALAAHVYPMVAAKVLAFLDAADLGQYEEGHLHGARELVSNLMANRACDKEAAGLAKLRRSIDAEQRQRPEPAARVPAPTA